MEVVTHLQIHLQEVQEVQVEVEAAMVVELVQEIHLLLVQLKDLMVELEDQDLQDIPEQVVVEQLPLELMGDLQQQEQVVLGQQLQ